MADNNTLCLWLNVPDRQLSLECKYQYVENPGIQHYNNLYIVPTSIAGDSNEFPAGAQGLWVSDVPPSSNAYMLSPAKGTAVGTFLLQYCIGGEPGVFIFQIPKESGFVAHANPWGLRVLDCAHVTSAQSFLTQLGQVVAYNHSVSSSEDVAKALDASIGAIQCTLPMDGDLIQQMEFELGRRLAFPWLSPEPILSYRVCVALEGAISINATKTRWETAASLGIKVVILSSGTWWMDNSGPFTHLREGFVEMDMTPDSGLSQRIEDAVKSYPQHIDGICAVSDGLLVPVAEAAKHLGLFTNGPEPFSISTNKYLTRQLLDPGSKDYFGVNSLKELDSRLASNNPVEFPVVCKPFTGRGSEGVFRADNTAQMKHAVIQALGTKNSLSVLVEPYVDGPEVDCNVILLHGRVLYTEVIDDFPSAADMAEDATDKLFGETEAVVPSMLPQEEQKAITDYVIAAVRLQGFHTGVFHCEARVRNSAMEYILSEGSTIPDLEFIARPTRPRHPISIFLHEINARVPGIASSAATMIARGIDFWALQLLCSVRDWSRYEAFSVPFSHDDHCDHVWLTNAVVPITYTGVRSIFPDVPKETLDHKLVDSSHNPVLELSEDHGNMTRYVLRHNANVKDGVKYGLKEGEWLWIACLVISSPISRQHARLVAESLHGIYSNFVKLKYQKF